MAKDTQITLRNKVIYQIFTRNYKDGTFKAVENDLERIKALGVDIVYLLPIQPSGEVHRKGSMGSPYAIKDYRAVDPAQGTMDDFKSLCNKIHEMGMKVMIDVVYNHTSPDSVLAMTHPEWFYHKADGTLGNRVGDWWDVVDLDYSHMELWEYQIETLKMWAEYVDGYRCDVAPMIPLDFWKRARKEVSEIKPDFIWLAEAVEPSFISYNRNRGVPTSSDSELFEAFDLAYDYDVYGLQKDAMTGANSLRHFLARVNLQEGIYPENYVKLRCLENHDRARAACLVPDEKSLRNWTAFQFFEKGTPMLYAGQEFEVTKHPTLFDRDTVDFNTGKDISSLIGKLAEIKKEDIFTDSSFNAKGLSSDVIFATAERKLKSPFEDNSATNGKNKLVGIFSTKGTPKSISTNIPDGTYTDLISGKNIHIFEGVVTLTSEPLIFYVE